MSKLTFGAAIGNSAKDRAAARAVVAPVLGARVVPCGTGWRVYVSRYHYLLSTFATEADALAALAAHKVQDAEKRAAKKRRNALSQFFLRPLEDGTVVLASRKFRATVAGPFPSHEAATQYARANADELAKWRPAEPERATVPVDLTGRQIDPTELLARFNLRGVEFGVWESSRVGALAALVADALAELARILGVTESALGLDSAPERGTLALALGARGHGKASAHYEPGRNVINLTKTRGAGTLAHEWGHALDYSLRRTDRSRLRDVSATIDGCDRWILASAAQDAGRAKPYWASREEMIARSFEAWINTKTTNRFLVCIDGYANVMPAGAELERICAAWDRVFPQVA